MSNKWFKFEILGIQIITYVIYVIEWVVRGQLQYKLI